MKALRAVLAQPKATYRMAMNGDYPFNRYYYMMRDGDGYRSYSTSLGLGTWHMVLVAKRPGFLPCVSEEAVWQVVNSAAHTTPLLRSWAPWLYQELVRKPMLLKDADCFGCKCGLMNLADDRLDKLVIEAVKKKQLAFV